MDGKSGILRQGERRQVTALFADVVGFSYFASQADAEDLQDWLDSFYGEAQEIVEAAGGEITEFLGDGIVAVFGLSRADEHVARRAVESALQIVTLPGFVFPDGKSVSMRAGVATGEVATRGPARAGNSRPRMTGMVTTLAQRLQAATPPATVLIAPETRDALRGAIGLQAMPDTQLKGFAPMTVYQVLDKAVPLPTQRLDQGARELIGRARERAAIDACKGRPCLLRGPAGIGKTTLANAYLRAGRRFAVFPADALNTGEGYGPFRHWLRSLLPDAQADFAALQTRFGGMDADNLLCLALVLELPQGNALLSRFANNALRDKIEASLSQAIMMVVPDGVLLFEDLHWMDSASFGALRHLIGKLDHHRHRLLLTSRETPRIAQNLQGLAIETLEVAPFAQDEAETYLQTFGPALQDPQDRARLIRHADGNPLFLEQLVKHTLRNNPAAGDLPATLSDLLTERIDAAGPARFVLLQASVLGRSFSQRLLTALAAPAKDVAQMLQQARQADLVRAIGPDRWTFSHAMLHRAAYRQLLRGTREALHARVAELLQGSCAEMAEATPALLANHQKQAKLFLPAARSFLAASRQALLRGALSDAEDHARNAITICGEAGERPGRNQLEIAAYTALGSILMQSQGYAAQPVRAAFSEVLHRAAQSRSGSGNGPALFGSYSHAIIAGDRKGADELCGFLIEAAEIAENRQAPDRIQLRLAAEAAANCGCFYAGNFRDQLAHVAEIRRLYRIERDAPMMADYGMDIFAAAQMFELPGRVFCGDIDALSDLIAETDRHQQALSIPVMQPYALIWGSVPLDAAGRRDEALARLDRGIAVAAEQGAGFWSLIGLCWQHVIDPRQSETDAGRARFEQLLGQLRTIGALIGLPYFTAHFAAAQARAGHLTEALALSARAVSEGAQSRLLCWQAETLRLHAGIAARLGDTDLAMTTLQKAIALAQEQGAHLWQLRASWDMADLAGGDTGALQIAQAQFSHAQFAGGSDDLAILRGLQMTAPAS
ncbi:AAA family ATPase [Paracoccus sp. Z330]|uniref:AAA family ATPase n=1 Tax=Paracoccus onchidii TaxID=3017813 RepID=A0ABT4ZCP2_9RHOB|nr:adenylate/guanylate cyclase domain-containing protein [Paracoccus onchidii]MDB6177126.1 AAA family ATPase [Paracoccus onchidii]